MNKTLSALAVVLGLALTGCSKTPAEKEAAFLAKGKALLDKKDYPRAVLEFQNAIQTMPKRDAEPYYMLGLAYAQLNNMPAATQAFQTAVEINPKHPGAQLKLAEIMAESSNKNAVEDAVKRLGTVFGDKPEDTEVLHTLAVAEVRLGDLSDAVQHLQQALSKAPTDLQSSIGLARIKMTQGDRAGADAVMKAAVQSAPKSVETALAAAQYFLLTKRVDEGNLEVHRALQLDSNNEPALVVLATIQSSQGQTGEAEKTYKRLSQFPDKRFNYLYSIFLFQQGKRDQAVAELERLAKADPHDKDMRSRLVAAYMDVNKFQQAQDLLTEALKHDARDPQAMLQRSELYLRLGKSAEAEKDAHQLVELQPESSNAHYALSRVLLAEGSQENRRHELNETLRLDPNLLRARVELSQAWIDAGDTGAAVDTMNRTPQAQKDTAAAIIAGNWAFLAHGDETRARTGIDRGLAIQRLPALLYEDAILKTIQRDYAAARKSLDEMVKTDPENLRAWTLLANDYSAQKQSRAAVLQLQQVVTQHPKSAKLQYLLARWLIDSGNQSEARSALAAAKSADPAMIDADLALAQLDYSAGKLDSARNILNGVIAKYPKSTPARKLLADVEERAGNISAAIDQYRAIVDVDPKQIIALNNLAYHLLKNNPDEALTYAQQADQLAPDSPAVQDTMGWAYYRKGLYGPAVQHLKKAVAKDGTPLRKYHLGMAYLKTGDEKQGQETIRAALRADPSVAKESNP
ncbi:MAG TPA: tetratricopeptide repeat protein [Bryobacteraceae bacterium]|jgi:tetratricopeptide (TPR) repeat protein